eukprot:76697_1
MAGKKRKSAGSQDENSRSKQPKKSRKAVSTVRKKGSSDKANSQSSVQNGDVNDIRIHLQNAPIDEKKIASDRELSSALYLAVEDGDIEVVGGILENVKVDVNKTDGDGCTPLHLAASNGNADIVRI